MSCAAPLLNGIFDAWNLYACIHMHFGYSVIKYLIYANLIYLSWNWSINFCNSKDDPPYTTPVISKLNECLQSENTYYRSWLHLFLHHFNKAIEMEISLQIYINIYSFNKTKVQMRLHLFLKFETFIRTYRQQLDLKELFRIRKTYFPFIWHRYI